VFSLSTDQLINKPTRETNTSATLNDLVLTNAKENISTSGVIDLEMSDDSLIYVVRKFTLPKLKPNVREVRDYIHFNAEYFIGDLARMPWHVINQHNNPKECWRAWKSFFNEILNIHAPIRHKRVKGNSVPWITPEIKCMMRNRDYHKKHAIKHSSNSQPHWESFQFLRNNGNVEMRNTKSKYFHDKITDCSVMNDPKDLEIN
jgi:DNA polymerase II small subunit/DNA polymerase delta subunit B